MTKLERPDTPPNPLSEDEKLDLAIALAKRQNLFDLGLARMRQQYPSAPDALLQSGAYHLYAELAGAFIDVLAQLELTLRNPQHRIAEVQVFHPAYHLYNWLQLEALLPWARADFFAELKALKECLSGDDVKGASELLETIFQQFEGSSPPPMPDFP